MLGVASGCELGHDLPEDASGQIFEWLSGVIGSIAGQPPRMGAGIIHADASGPSCGVKDMVLRNRSEPDREPAPAVICLSFSEDQEAAELGARAPVMFLSSRGVPGGSGRDRMAGATSLGRLKLAHACVAKLKIKLRTQLFDAKTSCR